MQVIGRRRKSGDVSPAVQIISSLRKIWSVCGGDSVGTCCGALPSFVKSYWAVRRQRRYLLRFTFLRQKHQDWPAEPRSVGMYCGS
jgi:hypothetical protein